MFSVGGGCEDSLSSARLKPTTKEAVISKLKDDGDFDELRLKLIRKLKENDELRSNIISIVRRSDSINRADSQTLRPRQLSDAIFEECSNGGISNDIRDRVEAVYDKIVNSEEGKEKCINRDAKIEEIEEFKQEAEPDAPPGFVLQVKDEELNNESGEGVKNEEEEDLGAPPGFSNEDDEDPDVPPGFG